MRKSVEIPRKDAPPLTGRDAGKTFIITEMAAIPTEEWGQRAYGCMVRSGLKTPQLGGVLNGLAAVSVYGLSAFLAAPWVEVQPLLREMIDKCVKIKEEAFPLGRALTDDDIEEVVTLLNLREEAVKLHTDFSLSVGVLSAVAQVMVAMADPDEGLSPTPTLQTISERLSVLEKRASRNSKRSTPPKTRGS